MPLEKLEMSFKAGTIHPPNAELFLKTWLDGFVWPPNLHVQKSPSCKAKSPNLQPITKISSQPLPHNEIYLDSAIIAAA